MSTENMYKLNAYNMFSFQQRRIQHSIFTIRLIGISFATVSNAIMYGKTYLHIYKPLSPPLS